MSFERSKDRSLVLERGAEMRVVRRGAVQFGERNAKMQTTGADVDWLNIHRSTLAAEQFLGCDPVQRATWLCLLAYCADQENGGRIEAADTWVDRKWQQVVRVTRDEVRDSCPLWSWDGACVVVWAYPAEKEAEVRRNRENGKAGGRPPKPSGNQVVSSGLTQTEPSAPISAETERKGKERKGMGRECLHASAQEQAIPCSDFSTTQEHQDICAFRGASFEHQLARFRDLNKSATDIAQGWEMRFRSFCSKSRPEVNQAPISPPSPRQEQKRPTWTIERDIRDEEGRLKTAQGERKECRDQRNRFSMGQGEYTRHDAEMRKADAKIAASETRLVELRNEMDKAKEGGA